MSDRIQTTDKIDLHYRQQLSALIDGALAPDEARFLLRRMQHDGDLADCWERWQLAGEVLRGRATAVLPAGFAVRVGAMIAADSTAGLLTPMPRARWRHWGGSAALAASVAVVALLAWRQGPDADTQRQASPIAAATPAPAIETPRPAAVTPEQGVAGQARATPSADSVVVADAPRRSAQRPRPAQRRRAEVRPSALDGEPVEIAAAPAMVAPQSPRPFAAGTLPATRPWPRAVLPQFGTGGALTTDADASASPSFYPFEPRLPGDVAEPDAATPPTPR